jgi:NAD+ diphosphatase
MLNYTVTVDQAEKVSPNEEIDAWNWLSIDEARRQIRPNSLARTFLLKYLNKCKLDR